MATRDLGSKFVCFKCACKFYDLRKPDPVCPKCGADQRESPANRPAEPRKSRLAAAPKIVEPILPAPESTEEEPEEFEDEAAEETPDAEEP